MSFDGGGEHLLGLFDGAGVMAEPTLELRRRMMRLAVLQGVCNERLEREIEAAEEHFGPDALPEIQGALLSWRAGLAYHQHDFAASIELDRRALALRQRRSAKISCLSGISNGLLDNFQYEEAGRVGSSRG